MSSVQDIEKCKCGGKAYVDFDLRTSEEDKFCSHCGYTFEHLLNRDEHGNPTDGNYQTTIQDGYGSLFISYITDDFRIRCFHEPISGEIVEKFFNEINHNPLIDKKTPIYFGMKTTN